MSNSPLSMLRQQGVNASWQAPLSGLDRIAAQRARIASMTPAEREKYLADIEGPRRTGDRGSGAAGLQEAGFAGNGSYNSGNFSPYAAKALSMLGFFNSERYKNMDSVVAADISGILNSMFDGFQRAGYGDQAAFLNSFPQGTQFMRDAALPYLEMGAQYEIDSGNPGGLANQALQAVRAFGPKQDIHFENMRLPDYYSFNGGLGVSVQQIVGVTGGQTGNLGVALLASFIPSDWGVGASGSLSVDRYGGVYWGINGSMGYSRGTVGLNATVNWINSSARPSADQLRAFQLDSSSANAAYGAALSQSVGPKGMSATGFGVGTPELSVSVGKTRVLLEPKK